MGKNVLLINGHQYWEISKGKLNKSMADFANNMLTQKGYAVKNTHVEDAYNPEEEVEKMRKEAQAHAAEDSKLKEEVEVRNQADATLYQSEKQMKEMGEKLDGEAKSKLETAIGRLKEAQKGSNLEEMKSEHGHEMLIEIDEDGNHKKMKKIIIEKTETKDKND